MKMKCRQRMMAVNRFPDHNPIGAPFQCGFQGRSRRRTVVYYKDTNQAISLSRSSVYPLISVIAMDSSLLLNLVI